jgi:tetratricopeptide (TPR) repeat protein
VGAGSPYVSNNLAWLYLEHGGDASAALSLAQEAQRLLPDSALAAGTLGWAFYKAGAYQLAVTQLTLSTQEVPDNPENQYHLGMAYLGERRFELAAQSLERALKINPGFAGAESAKAALETIAKKPRK